MKFYDRLLFFVSFEPGTVHAPSGLSNDKYAKLLFAQPILCLKKPQTCSVNIILFLNIIGRYFLIFRCFFAIGKDEVHEFDSRHQLQLKPPSFIDNEGGFALCLGFLKDIAAGVCSAAFCAYLMYLIDQIVC